MHKLENYIRSITGEMLQKDPLDPTLATEFLDLLKDALKPLKKCNTDIKIDYDTKLVGRVFIVTLNIKRINDNFIGDDFEDIKDIEISIKLNENS